MAKLITTAEKLEKLKLFEEKAAVLRRRNFVSQVFRPDHGFTLNMNFDNQEPTTIQRRGADEEALHAFAVTLRFFVQDRDGITVEQMAQIYETLPVEDEAKRCARAAADGLKSYLNSPTELNIFGEVITRGRLFEVFMYGNLAHANDDKRQQYEKWMKHPFAAAFLPTFLEETIAHLTNYIFAFHQMNTRTIQQLEAS